MKRKIQDVFLIIDLFVFIPGSAGYLESGGEILLFCIELAICIALATYLTRKERRRNYNES